MVDEFWNNFCLKNGYQNIKYREAFQFGVEADLLAKLVVDGEKTATTSGFDFYALDNEEVPKVEDYSIVLNSKDEPVAIIKTTNVDIVPFNEVSEEFAIAEGEGDFEFWKKSHTNFFKDLCQEYSLEYKEDMLVVCERFTRIF